MLTTAFNFEAIGTHWRIDVPQTTTAPLRKTLIDKVIILIEDFDKTYSRFRPDSLVTQMSEKKGTYTLPENAATFISLYQKLYTLTDGAFTPLIGQVLVDAGYDASYSLVPKTLQTPPRWEDVIQYSHPKLTLLQPALLDFGAADKGYLIDLVTQVLREYAVPYFCVEAGGDMYYQSNTPELLRVGLEHPDDDTKVIGIAKIRNQSICASAGNRRKWGQYHHIVDPHTLTSPDKIKATWVVADTALLTDAIATCLFFTPAAKLREKYNFSYAIVNKDLSLEVSPDFPAEMYTI